MFGLVLLMLYVCKAIKSSSSEAYKNLSLPEPKVIAGHSLGEYSALLFAESITFEDAIKITCLLYTSPSPRD